MATSSNSDSIEGYHNKGHPSHVDIEKQPTHSNEGEDLNPTAPKTLGAGVSEMSTGIEPYLTITDCSRNWSVRNNINHAISELDGVARCHYHQCICRELLLRSGFRSLGHGAMGAFSG